ncbi:MAG TPA: LamG-like jellyroll fold domain-containing protein [Lacipirellulaceae bacterium]|nr:LamG-like jellyroll fold domain-containing protein [Lacipirellulaceae bacterium]
MTTSPWISRLLVVATVALAGATTALGNGTLIASYKMGEEEGGTNNSPVSFTSDSPLNASDITNYDLGATNSPVYRTITGRPDGGTGVGIQFTGTSNQYLYGLALNRPDESPWSTNGGGQYNLNGIDDRAFQLWVRPTSTAAQTIVMDTNNHGVRIDANGKFSMRYVNTDYESPISAVPNTWYHIEVVRPAGDDVSPVMYINGSAAAVAPASNYPSDLITPLSIGTNTTFSSEFFSGTMDDLRFLVFGSTDSGSSVNYGAFNLLTDNAYLASQVSGLKGVAGDVNNDGILNDSDKTAFVAGWMHKHIVDGVQIGDLTSRLAGDFNFDGITDISDLLVLQNALHSAGLGTLTAADFAGVPEPATGAMLLSFINIVALATRRRR